MKTQSEVATQLDAARARLNLKYTDLAKTTGLSVLAVRQALQGHTAMRVTTMMALADALGLEMVLLPKMVARSMSEEGAGEGVAPVLTSVERALQRVRPEPLSFEDRSDSRPTRGPAPTGGKPSKVVMK
jgi:cyanate lyase